MKSDPLEYVHFARTPHPHGLWTEFFGPYPWFFVPLLGMDLVANGVTWRRIFDSGSYDSQFKLKMKIWARGYPWGQWDAISAI